MKPSVGDKIQLLIDTQSDFSEKRIPKGVFGYIIEIYDDPEGYCIDLEVPDDNLINGLGWENKILTSDQFQLINSDLDDEI